MGKEDFVIFKEVQSCGDALGWAEGGCDRAGECASWDRCCSRNGGKSGPLGSRPIACAFRCIWRRRTRRARASAAPFTAGACGNVLILCTRPRASRIARPPTSVARSKPVADAPAIAGGSADRQDCEPPKFSAATQRTTGLIGQEGSAADERWFKVVGDPEKGISHR